MSVVPSSLARVPNILLSRLSLNNINRTNVDLFAIQQQLSTGRALNLPSDDPVKAATVGTLDDRLDRSTQIRRNLDHATSNLNILDNALAEANTIGLDAKSIAQTQIGLTSSPEERRSQATIVEQLIQSLYNVSTRTGPAGYLFGGSLTSQSPIQQFGNGYRYVGSGPGLVTDIPSAGNVPITLAASNAIGATSARVRGFVDFNPSLTPDTRLTDVAGVRGLGVAPGTIEFSINAGPRVRVDLAGADSVQDVTTRLTNAIRQYESDNSITALGAGGVSTAGGSLSLDVLAGNSVEFFDLPNGVTAQDLGLVGNPAIQFTNAARAGLDIKPELTWRTPIAALAGVTGPLGQFRVNNLGRSAVVDLSQATTLEDIKNAIQGANLGVSVTINAEGNGLDVVNEVSAGADSAMSIEEIPGNNSTATRLGLRSFAAQTLISDFNDGRGVKINDQTINPQTGQPDPTRDSDIKIVLGDSAGTVLSIDLRPQDMATVQTVIDRINSQASAQLAAAGLPTTALVAELRDGTNGLVLRQDASFTGAIRVDALNNSPAAEQLGLMNGAYDASSASLVGQDRAKVRVDNLFTRLIDLRDALLGNDSRGMTLAGEGLESLLANLAETRGLVGGYANRVEAANSREEDRAVLDESIRSDLRDADFTEAATRLSLLQTQLQAGLRVSAQLQQQSLLDFLG